MSADFWSRRRRAVEKEARAEDAALARAEVAERDAALAERSDEELLAEAGLPDPEMLESPEAVREFMASALPQRLKTRALRRLWRLNPVLANLDGLVEYGEDYTDAANVVENLQTAYQVGKGMLRHVEEMARQTEALAAPEEVETVTEQVEDLPAEPVEADAAEIVAETAAPGPEEAAERPPAPRRRMTFTFDEQRTG